MTTRLGRHAAAPSRRPGRALLAGGSTVVLAGMLAGVLWLPAQAAGQAPADALASPASAPSTSAPAATADPSTSGDPSSSEAPDFLAGLGPLPKAPAARAAYVKELRTRISAAQAEHLAATKAFDETSLAATQAARVAVAAEQRASLARDRLTLWTSYLYRVSGNTGLILAIFNDPTADPEEFLRGAADADTFSEGFIRDLTEAHDAAVAARMASAEATQLQAAARQRAETAEAARLALVALLKPAQAVTVVKVAAPTGPASAGATGPQVVIDGRACPTSVPAGALRDGSSDLGALALCQKAVAQAATPQAALAIQAAFQMLGAPYACQGIGRQDPFRFDCSSLVSRAYYLGAGIDTAGANWAPSTRDMVPWDGVPLAWWASFVDPKNLRPGDLVLYDTGGSAYRHVVMYLGNGYMLHTNSCGDVAHVSSFWGFETGGHRSFLVVRRVVAPGGYRVPDPKPIPTGGAVPVAKPDPGAGDPKVAVPPTPTPTTPPATPTTTPATPTDVPTTEAPSGSSSGSASSPPTDAPTTSSPTDDPSTGPTSSSTPTESVSTSASGSLPAPSFTPSP